jgi:hypothetical protein
MRAVIRAAITSDVALQSLGVVDSGVLSGDVDTPEPRPFLNLKWGITTPAPFGGAAYQNVLTIWVHDEPNDYARIDAIIKRLRVLLPSLVGMADSLEGDYVSQITWTGDSQDFKDDGHRTVTRQTSYIINGSQS